MPEDVYKKIFSKNLNYYMELNKKTQTDLINDLGFDKSAVSTWCNGTRLPRMDKIEILAQYFKINRSDLIEEKPKSEIKCGGEGDISERLKQARILAHKTQKEVADMLGMTYQAISNYERGKTKVENDILIKLCQIYGVSISEILLGQQINIQKPIAPPSEPDKRLQKIIHCYNEMDDMGREILVGQAEYWLEKHPRTKEKEV